MEIKKKTSTSRFQSISMGKQSRVVCEGTASRSGLLRAPTHSLTRSQSTEGVDPSTSERRSLRPALFGGHGAVFLPINRRRTCARLEGSITRRSLHHVDLYLSFRVDSAYRGACALRTHAKSKVTGGSWYLQPFDRPHGGWLGEEQGERGCSRADTSGVGALAG